MFPKSTVKAAVTPAEKPPFTAKKESTVVYMVDPTDLQVAVENDIQWRIKRAAICACVFLLTVLILVAGTLGAIAILSVHNDRLRTSEPEPSIHESVVGNLLPTHPPKTTKQIKIDDGGLWLAVPVTPDPFDVDNVTAVNEADSDIVSAPLMPPSDSSPKTTKQIKIDDGGLLLAVPVTTEYDLLDVDYVTAVNDADSDKVSAPLMPSSDSSSNPDSSSSSEDDYGKRNWISSSFPYKGYYMRGGVGIPPWEQSNWVGPSMDDPSTKGTSRPSEVSGDGAELSGDGALSDQEYEDESSIGSGDDGIPSSDDYDDYSSKPSSDDYRVPDQIMYDYYYFS